jgi:hypothetical protein
MFTTQWSPPVTRLAALCETVNAALAEILLGPIARAALLVVDQDALLILNPRIIAAK